MPRNSWLLGSLGLLAAPAVAHAGMPAIILTDVARLRVQTISFFLLAFLLSAWGIQAIWNRLGRDFPQLPRVGYLTALGLTTLWGLLFILVLTMISGARELMTPGAWEKAGYTYRLKTAPVSSTDDPSTPQLLAERQAKLETLRIALWGWAAQHGGSLPASIEAAGLHPGTWETPDAARFPYLYFGNRSLGEPAPLAAEPEVFGAERLVLLADGRQQTMTSDALADVLAQKGGSQSPATADPPAKPAESSSP